MNFTTPKRPVVPRVVESSDVIKRPAKGASRQLALPIRDTPGEREASTDILHAPRARRSRQLTPREAAGPSNRSETPRRRSSQPSSQMAPPQPAAAAETSSQEETRSVNEEMKTPEKRRKSVGCPGAPKRPHTEGAKKNLRCRSDVGVKRLQL